MQFCSCSFAQEQGEFDAFLRLLTSPLVKYLSMRFSTLPWRLCMAFASSFFLHTKSALAAPSVNVALRASFDAAPYLVELLYVQVEIPILTAC